MNSCFFYRPQESCGQGNVFTGVCVHRGGGCLPQCMLGCHPPWTRQTPPGPGRHPPGRPPQTRQTPGTRQTPPGTRHTPLGPGRPPGTRQTPPGKHTPAYGLRAAGTHPTGMHSCLLFFLLLIKFYFLVNFLLHIYL